MTFPLKYTIAILGLILVHLFAFSATESREGEMFENYRIQPGDVIRITVYGEDDLFRELQVSANGKIIYPLIGEIAVQQNTPHELVQYLTERLNEYLVDPQVSVFIAQFGKIYIFGEVVNPGAFELSKKITLLEGITLAGGFTEHANPKKIKIIRKKDGKKETFQTDLTAITQKGNQEKDIILYPGDVVVVPESFL